MSFFLYQFFHDQTNDRTEKGAVVIPEKITEWSDSWKTIEYKNYILFKPLHLPKVETAFGEILRKRRSAHEVFGRKEITLHDISHILQCGYGLQDRDGKKRQTENRTVPSAGRRYPLELYVFLFEKTDDLASGIYHYGIQDHNLEVVALCNFDDDLKRAFSTQEVIANAKGMVCISSVFHRVVEKYGSRGYRYALLEAGHVAQNITLAGAEVGISFMPIGGINESVIEKFVGLNSRNEGVLYALYF